MKRSVSCLLKKITIVFLIITLLAISVSSQSSDPEQAYHLKLLAVQETSQGFSGSDADLFLELKPGNGRVFLDTFPLTKLDTQISTRFAKEIACNYYNLNCNQYDFIFTIKADSNIIGGPSAGAAISALTTIAVLDLEYDEKVSITGTINSGGIVGPVGGIKEKVEAAGKAGLNKVMIAQGTRLQNNNRDSENAEEENNSNQTKLNEKIDVIKFAQEKLNLEVVEVIDLDQVIYHLTGKNLNHKEISIDENNQYTTIMKGLRDQLCERNDKMLQEIENKKIVLNQSILETVQNKINKAENSTIVEDYYSAASYCFNANIDLRREYYQEKNPSLQEVEKLFIKLQQDTKELETTLNQEKIETISDLQASMVVKERINDVKQQINDFQDLNLSESESIEQDIPTAYSILAYAEERLFSAQAWSEFFTMDGKKFQFNIELLRQSCLQKISESEERQEYVSLFIPETRINEKITTAKKALEQQEFTLCLITAAQAKADANAILSSIGLTNETTEDFSLSKRKAVERVVAENSAEGIFPILGYSYYQYANTLTEAQPYTALVYYEYALEMSELDIYFPEEKEFLEKENKIGINQLSREWVYLIVGIFIGMLIMVLWNYRNNNLIAKNKR